MTSETDFGKTNLRNHVNFFFKNSEQHEKIETDYLKPINHAINQSKNPINSATVLNQHKKVNYSNKQINDLNV